MRQGKSAASLLMAQSKFIFTWREEGLYEEAKRLHPFVTNKCVPDVAFQLDTLSVFDHEITGR